MRPECPPWPPWLPPSCSVVIIGKTNESHFHLMLHFLCAQLLASKFACNSSNTGITLKYIMLFHRSFPSNWVNVWTYGKIRTKLTVSFSYQQKLISLLIGIFVTKSYYCSKRLTIAFIIIICGLYLGIHFLCQGVEPFL